MSQSKHPLDRLQHQIHRASNSQTNAPHTNGLIDLAHALVGPSPTAQLDCQTYQETLPDYIEAELNGQPVRRMFPALTRHLDTCPICGSMHVDLLEIARASETSPAPEIVQDLDLTFLPSPSLTDQARQVVIALTQGILSQLNASLLSDLPDAANTLFKRIDGLTELHRFQMAPDFAQSFGAGLPPALQAIAATYTATERIIHTLTADQLEAELSGHGVPRTVEKLAHASARSAGMGGKKARQWAEQYATMAQAHAADLMALARLAAGHSRSD